ncbi:MAG: glycoside hydrolase family 3 N-terminal domain-containing protein [Anaerolineaceae bacterium]|nr:glycoside hydrolase family 3 N-terminal domain-containing protein [Anaerolineaceae bacterium]
MKRIFNSLLVVCMLVQLFFVASPVNAANRQQSTAPAEKAYALFQKMNAEQRVGQLFLVSFTGTDVSETSKIFDLIKNRYVGGVLLEQVNDNFTGPEGTAAAAQNLINSLQTLAIQKSDQTDTSPKVPLFVGISQEGDGSPNDQILSGLTPLADEMAIGATWDVENAQTTGQVLGKELSSLGFNLLLGPSLDVLDSTRTVDSEDLNTLLFGGDPYWVGQMGQAYIRGIHEGSNNQIAVIAKNFPGRGSADRPAENEVATVRKSLEQLKQIELAPFVAVTSGVTDPLQRADGLLVSHIRYQGFQGNIRATTKPVSLDSTALEQILALDEFSSWHKAGGIMVSDDLGTVSIQKFFDSTGSNFDARQVAKSAFLAGNDLLFLGNIRSTGDEDNYATVNKIIDQFLQKYNEDQAFAQKVDSAVLRLLTVKFTLYPDFNFATVLKSEEDLAETGTAQQTTYEVANNAVTLISPSLGEVDTVMPDPPQITDRIVFISDRVSVNQCSKCGVQTTFSAELLRDAVINLYGSQAADQIKDYRLSAFSFDDLKNLLDQTGDVVQMQDDLASADWIVLSFLGQNETAIGQQVVRRFLSERSDLIRNKHVIGFAFNAPYYLDATDISKLTAYYGIYGKTAPFIDTAARVLFQELIPRGSLPVSVAGVGYDLISATTPDPAQIIQLMLENGEAEPIETPTASLEPTQAMVFNVGDNLPIRTGIIVDHNGNPVPDGTVVRFMIDTGSSSGSVETVETVTSKGIARTTYRIASKGILEIRVQSEPALVSQTLQLDITDSGGVITAIEPTAMPTETLAAQEGETPQSTASLIPYNSHPAGLPTATDWLLTTILVIGLSAGIFWLGLKEVSLKWGIRWASFACISGYLIFMYLTLGMPGSSTLINASGSTAIALLSIAGVLIGWGICLIWWWLEKRKKTKRITVNEVK